MAREVPFRYEGGDDGLRKLGTAPSSLKAWIDHIVRVRRTFNVTPAGRVSMLRDRPVFVAVSRAEDFLGSARVSQIFLLRI